jgi:hypothetical protein
LKTLDEFTAFLERRESEEATEELLRIPGFLEDMARAKEEIARGETVSWEDLKQEIKRPRKGTSRARGVSGRPRAGAGSPRR